MTLSSDVRIEPAHGDRFDEVARIVGPADPTKPGCWCLSYRVTSGEFQRLEGEERPAHLRALCERDVAPGLVATVDGEAAGWVALGPREEMGRLVRSRTIQRVDDRTVWSVVCFVVRAPFRRRGLADQLLEAAVTYAREQGAPVVEGYPVEPGEGRVSSSLAYVGTTSMFERAGFERVEPTLSKSGGRTRWIMRREL